jgi:phage-related minor tail protein
MIDKGWIKLHRRIIEKGYYKKSEIVHLWIHILLKANHKPNEFYWNKENIKVDSGQFITGRKTLSEETGINESMIERILKILENEQQIEQQKTTKFRLITVKNWVSYQIKDLPEQQIEQQVNNKRTTDEQQVNTNKNDKKEENEKNEKKEPKDIAVKTPQNDFLDNLIIIFSEEYLIAKGIDYITQSQDKKSIARLLASYKKKNKDSDSVKCFKDFRNLFRSACEITEDNFLSQISISFLNSQINKYFNYIKNGKPKQSYGNKSKGFDIDKERRIAERLASIN